MDARSRAGPLTRVVQAFALGFFVDGVVDGLIVEGDGSAASQAIPYRAFVACAFSAAVVMREGNWHDEGRRVREY